MLGPVLLAAARSDSIRRLVAAAPVTRPVVDRFVAGERLDESMAAVRSLAARGLEVTLDHLGEDITDPAEALRNRDAYLQLAAALKEHGLGVKAEMSVKLSAFGQALAGGHELALKNVTPVVEAAAEAGTTVTLDMEDHTTVDSTLAILADLRERFPQTGAVLQSYLFRTEDDCHALAGEGSRVRLVKGAYKEPATVAFQDKREVDKAYVRCLKILMAGEGYPMIGSHDPRMVAIGQELAHRNGRKPADYEFQMLYGIREAEQQRLVAEGHRMRVYIPYGTDWYGYFMRRLAERPANLAFFLRSLATRG
ncbi:proline dehydrogenase family protein [Streptomyces libani]|uniref:proline dehydrogenase n=2 Tax=Streptomyces nigrescens TaxID=1920 RepID=A0A640TH72_STRNI|nr:MULTISPECIES: proline dehydrogenase family protein [Streptomyces]MCW7988834.1 proline dehydrogenase [Streptomyces platensis subsp. clarensis]AWN29681.1 proline dehydrogenase [Streptomyces sp. NEAU-S7GS2]MCR8578668.1 proline dehydrogenase family protein [Streptomyces sp. Isolate_219]MCX5448150.1 proline dehydrogenase family protein [Streptomyces libani]MYT13554.1 proline dehydrogenase [Streptomyces sp. SID4951]